MDISARPRIMLRSAVQVGHKNQDDEVTFLRFTFRFRKTVKNLMRIVCIKSEPKFPPSLQSRRINALRPNPAEKDATVK